MESEDQFLKRLKETFRIEADEHLKALSSGLLQLETNRMPEEQSKIAEAIFREAHSLKGAARAVNMSSVEEVCQSLETLFSALKSREVEPSMNLLDAAHNAVNTIGELVLIDDTVSVSPTHSGLDTVLEELSSVQQSGKKTIPEKTEATESIRPLEAHAELGAAHDTVRISTKKLDKILLEAEEMLAVKRLTHRRLNEIRQINTELQHWKKEWRGKIYTNKQAGSLDDNELSLKNLENSLKHLLSLTEHDLRSVSTLVDQFLEGVKEVLLMPFGTVFEGFPKLVRDISRDEGKEVDLFITGSEVEIDKRILEILKDPLIHLLRNSVSHGIERPEIRLQSGKERRGRIDLNVRRIDGSKIEISIEDDGAGIDLNRVKEIARKKRLASEDELNSLTMEEVQSLVFQPELSTSPLITNISGRGLGLAIVKEKVEKLGGLIVTESVREVGTTFRIVVPMTLSLIRALQIEVAGQSFVIPTTHVERIIRFGSDEIRTVEGQETLLVQGQTIPLVNLAEILELPFKPTESAICIIIANSDKRVAFRIDSVTGEEELLVKNLGEQLKRVRNVAGAAMLPSGKMAPVLNSSDLVKSSNRRRVLTTRVATEEKGTEQRSILVAEDSITSRMLVKNILESAGYNVRTAVDGAEAYATLKTENFDLVVSDVEMPRMSGFDLTSKIRNDKELSELPVVLITALNSREDKERGVEAGANAYIVKSSLDQNSLLSTIQRLL
jgi:two-component system, chemotaxis family, sensor kinase CheA